MADVLAGRAATFSKGPEFFGVDFQPATLERGRGAYVIAPDGTRLLDWVSSLGALTLGHPDPAIADSPANHWVRAVCRQAWESAGFSLPHVLEGETAERLTALLGLHVPGWQHQLLGLRWGKTGSDACAMAVRLARAVTGRKWIISVGYHGWSDWAVSVTPPAHGVITPQFVWAVPFGELPSLQACFTEGMVDRDVGALEYVHGVQAEIVQPAAVIIEQPPQPIPDGYWQEVRRLCTEHGALLIVDEVVTWPRNALGGACERFGIEPDIICIGKGLGNGLPISAIVGRREYFDWFSRQDPVFVSSTHFGEAVSLAAAKAVLDVWDQSCVDHLWKIGTALMDGLRGVGYSVTGYPPVSLIQHESPSHRAYFIREMARKGFLVNRPNIPNLAHTVDDVRATVQAAGEVKQAMERIDVKAEMAGKLPATLFTNR